MSTDPIYEIKARIDALSCIAQTLPNDLGFQRTISSAFARKHRSLSSKLLSTCSKLSGFIDFDPVDLQSIDDIEDEMGVIVDTFDTLFEKVDLALDESKRGKVKEDLPVVSPPKSPQSKRERAKLLDPKIRHAAHIRKPQLDFKDPVDNSDEVFIPKITQKPNAKKPLKLGMNILRMNLTFIELTNNPSDISTHLESLGCNEVRNYVHPYKYEIETIEYPPHLFQKKQEILFAPVQNTPLTWVDTETSLLDMVGKLSSENEIAIDLEAHSHRSYQGFTCLMQLSTRKEDFIIDTLAVREHMRYLNQVFTDPEIVKVMHGAESDIVWLQRDFGVYVVNLFDTYHASHVLEMPKHSLAHLLEKYASVTLDKMYQLADWRIRPLPEEMARYAQEDTHYLLYVFDRIRNELLDKSNPETSNLMREVLRRSSETSLSIYTKPVYDSIRDWRMAAMKFRCYLTHEESFIFKYVHQWRDMVARREDESPHYVLANHSIVKIAKSLPKDTSNLISCCHPVSPLIRLCIEELMQLIENAIEDARAELDAKNAAAIETIEALKKIDAKTVEVKEKRITLSVEPLSAVLHADNSVKVAKSSAMFSDSSDSEPADDTLVENQQEVPLQSKSMFDGDSDEDSKQDLNLNDDLNEGKKKAELIHNALMETVDDYLPKPMMATKEELDINQQPASDEQEVMDEPEEKDPVVLRNLKRTRAVNHEPKEIAVTNDTTEAMLDFIVIDANEPDKTPENKETKVKSTKKMKFSNTKQDRGVEHMSEEKHNGKKHKKAKDFDPYSQIVIPSDVICKLITEINIVVEEKAYPALHFLQKRRETNDLSEIIAILYRRRKVVV